MTIGRLAWQKKVLTLIVLYILIFAIWSLFSELHFPSAIENVPVTLVTNLSLFPYCNWSTRDEHQALNSCLVVHFVGRLNVSQSPISFDALESEWGCSDIEHFPHNWTTQSYIKTMDSVANLSSTAPRNISSAPASVLWRPDGCIPQQAVAIIIPFRTRHRNLSVLLNHMHPFLRHQGLAYTIFVINQLLPGKFNRGSLLNIGFIEAMKLHPYSCIIFHDVDLLPEDDRNMYTCEDQPIHLSVAIDKFSYRLLYENIFGGVVALTPDQFRKSRGFPNFYFGWGGEDDDMSLRIRLGGMHFKRRKLAISRYTMLKHGYESENFPNPGRFQLLGNASKLWKNDTYMNCNYGIINQGLRYKGLFYMFSVKLRDPS